MTDDVRDAYDANAELYAELFLSALDDDANARNWLETFAKLAASQDGVVVDLGCGPGNVVDYLCQLGLTTVGYDLSPGQIAEARTAFPDREFHVGDLAALDHDDASLGGIVSRYSVIHLAPSRLGDVFAEWLRVLEPGAPVLVSFFGALTAESHGAPFDHKVVTAYELFPATVAEQLRAVGFVDVEIGVLPPPDGGRPLDQGTVLARKP